MGYGAGTQTPAATGYGAQATAGYGSTQPAASAAYGSQQGAIGYGATPQQSSATATGEQDSHICLIFGLCAFVAAAGVLGWRLVVR